MVEGLRGLGFEGWGWRSVLRDVDHWHWVWMDRGWDAGPWNTARVIGLHTALVFRGGGTWVIGIGVGWTGGWNAKPSTQARVMGLHVALAVGVGERGSVVRVGWIVVPWFVGLEV